MSSESSSGASRPRLKLKLRTKAETIVRGGHPWVYSDSIREQNREGDVGELAVIYDRKNKFLAVGFYDPDSPIRVRIVHVGKPATIDLDWWSQRLDEALARREAMADAETNGLRLINGESDGWPGLVADRYAETIVLKIYTPAWLEMLGDLAPMIAERCRAERVVLRTSRNLTDTLAERGGPRDGEILYGSAPEGVVTFLENGLRFESDVIKGQKTGFFLDQRENRNRVGELAKGCDVLNAFSFSGGFSLSAARGGARSVTDLDISEHALEAARRNFALNREIAAVANCDHRREQADAFHWIEEAPSSSFDLAIVDPPSLAKRESERARAIEAYRKLNSHAIRLIRKGGLLVAASCSAHVSKEEFFEAVRSGARQSGRRFEELESRGHAPDHAANFPEAEYLKCLYVRFETTP